MMVILNIGRAPGFARSGNGRYDHLATISDVAKRAGVSVMTVSRVINKSARVSDETIERVNQAIRELNYRPNMVARGLATRHTHMIAYVFSNLANPFFAAVSMGIQNACAEKGYTMILFDITSAERFAECMDTLIDRHIDGVVFHHLDVRQENVDCLISNGVCVATIDNEVDLEGVTSINGDDYEAARMATRHLIDRGYRRIGCVHEQYEDRSTQDRGKKDYIQLFQRRIWRNRTNGFLDEMRTAGLEPVCMIEGSGTADIAFAEDRESLHRILAAENRPCALYCENDIIAMAVLSESMRQGIRVPAEVAIIGHDGLDYGRMLYPRLTTVCQPRYEMGSLAAHRLIDTIEHKSPTEVIFTHSTVAIGDTT